jgi:Bacterial PH domain
VTDAPGPGSRQTFRSPVAVVIWWLWVLFAVATLIDIAVQGRDHLAVVTVFILLLVTGVAYVTAERPRIVTDDAGMTIMNPLRDHRVSWAAVAGIAAAELLRVRCEWPLGGEGEERTGTRAIYAWAVQSTRRKQAAAQLRADRHRARSRAPAGRFGVPTPPEPADQPPTAADAVLIVAELTALAERGRADTEAAPGPPVSTWYWPAFAALIIPALALVIAVLV